MDQPNPSPTFREKCTADRARADMLMEERRLRKEQKGLLLRYLPEAALVLVGFAALYLARVWIGRPLQELSEQQKTDSSVRFPYHRAYTQYLEGDIETAAGTLRPLLENQPDNFSANVLMARIEVARRQPSAALAHLEAARETALDRREIGGWITDLKSRLPQ